MELTLYTATGSRGLLCRWLLEELGLPYRCVILDIERGEHKQAHYRAIHPLGKVPALVIDGTPMIESLAICLYLADCASDVLLAPPLNGPDRAAYLQWMVYAIGSVEAALVPAFMRSLDLPPTARVTTATAEEQAAMAALLVPMGEGLERGHVLARGFSAVDVMMGCELLWARDVGLLVGAPRAVAYVAGVTARPAFLRAIADA